MSVFDVAGKIVFVTGGTRGLGRAISLHLARAGAKVHAGYFNNEAAAEAFRKEASEAGLACTRRHAGELHFMATDGTERFARVGTAFLGKPITAAQVELVDV